jgi:hypothetical protein
MTSSHGRQVPDTSRRRVASLVAKIELHPGELFPRVGFIATNRSLHNEQVLAFYNDRGKPNSTSRKASTRSAADARHRAGK